MVGRRNFDIKIDMHGPSRRCPPGTWGTRAASRRRLHKCTGGGRAGKAPSSPTQSTPRMPAPLPEKVDLGFPFRADLLRSAAASANAAGGGLSLNAADRQADPPALPPLRA